MRLLTRVVVCAGGMWFVLLHATAFCGQTSSGQALRRPVRGVLADGAPLYATPAASGEDVLVEMANRAAVIFVGTVTAVRKPSDEVLRMGSAGSVVEVDFSVQRSVRGTMAGSVYRLREWAGMWRDSPRFLPGQRLLMLLHAAGPGGLSSPVDGLDGAIPLRSGGVSATTALSRGDAAAQVHAEAEGTTSEDEVDMRWLQAKMLRMPSYADAPTASPGVSAPDGTGGEPVAASPATSGTDTLSGAGGTAGVGAAPEDGGVERLSRVLGLLGSVEALQEGTQRASN